MIFLSDIPREPSLPPGGGGGEMMRAGGRETYIYRIDVDAQNCDAMIGRWPMARMLPDALPRVAPVSRACHCE